MIELKQDQLVFSFPDIHPHAKLTIEFQRTLRIPDDDGVYPLPPGLGRFPVRHVDDYAQQVPASWLQRGGVMLPMYQSEALWLNFESNFIPEHSATYPFAIKVATGKVCAVGGKSWSDELERGPQNYMVAPLQPWLDGYVVSKGAIRQFVAMPLGNGYSAEEQLTGEAEFGGIQIAVHPMRRKRFEQHFPQGREVFRGAAMRCKKAAAGPASAAFGAIDMSLAPGGRMEQEIYDDPYDLSEWATTERSRCFVHLCNSMVWESITGDKPPHFAPTAKQYTAAGLPWYEYYSDKPAVPGAAKLAGMQSVAQMSKLKQEHVLPENESIPNLTKQVIKSTPNQVREGDF